MSKRKTAKQSISTEEAREAVKARRYDVAGVFQADPGDVTRLLEKFESQEYIALADHLQLVSDCVHQMIAKLDQLGSDFVSAVSIDGARAFLLSLLRVPPAQRDIEDKTNDREQTEEEMAKLRNEVRAAAKVASTVAKAMEKTGAPPSLEVVDQMIRSAGDDLMEGVRTQLETARAGDPPLTLNDNQELPVVLPMPPSLLSEHKYMVEIMVDRLSDRRHDFEATVTRVLQVDGVPLALKDLIDVPVRATFVPDKRGKVRRALLGGHLANKSVTVTVEVSRSFRASDPRHNALTIRKLNDNPDLASAMEQEVSQLKLDFPS